jgi:hypothetical protein
VKGHQKHRPWKRRNVKQGVTWHVGATAK